MIFAQPYWLLLLLVPALLIWRGKRRTTPLQMPQAAVSGLEHGWRARLRQRLPTLRWAAIILLIGALARPQRLWQEERVKADALDIMLALDISPSMLSRDFDPDRLSVAKQVATDFVGKRPYDRIGLVAFSAEAFTQCPLTTDRRVVQQFIRDLETGRLDDGTAIGMGLATAVNRLKNSEAKSKIVILLTDGENNAGYISPMQAAELAQALDIRVYTVGIGTDGIVMSPTRRRIDGTYEFGQRYLQFDTRLLEEIADKTKGRFYRAFSEADLQDIYTSIDRLEKTQIEVTSIKRSTELYFWLMGAAVALLLLEILLRWGWLRSITP